MDIRRVKKPEHRQRSVEGSALRREPATTTPASSFLEPSDTLSTVQAFAMFANCRRSE
jgi:hypothetical protein